MYLFLIKSKYIPTKDVRKVSTRQNLTPWIITL